MMIAEAWRNYNIDTYYTGSEAARAFIQAYNGLFMTGLPLIYIKVSIFNHTNNSIKGYSTYGNSVIC